MAETTLPIYLKFDGQSCLVIGGGEIAYRKVLWLLAAGARVEAISPEFISEMEELAESSPQTLHLTHEKYKTRDLSSYALIIAGTDDTAVNQLIAEDAGRARILLNVVDDPELCNFFVPATVQRGNLQIAIGTGGSFPALAKRIRKELQETFPDDYAGYVRGLDRMRTWLREKYGKNQPVCLKIAAMLASTETFQAVRDMDENKMFFYLQEIAENLGNELQEND